MSSKKTLKDIAKHELDDVVDSLKNKGAIIHEIKEQSDGLYTVIYEFPGSGGPDDSGDGGTGSFDIGEDMMDMPMSEEGGSRDFP